MSTNTEITAFLAEWAWAEQSGDTTVLAPLLTDDFVGVGPVGFVLDKSRWLQRFGNGLQLDELSLDEAHVRDYGDTAVVVGRQNQRGDVDGNPLPEAARATLVLLRQDDGWRLASIHLCFLAGVPGAPPLPGTE